METKWKSRWGNGRSKLYSSSCVCFPLRFLAKTVLWILKDSRRWSWFCITLQKFHIFPNKVQHRQDSPWYRLVLILRNIRFAISSFLWRFKEWNYSSCNRCVFFYSWCKLEFLHKFMNTLDEFTVMNFGYIFMIHVFELIEQS